MRYVFPSAIIAVLMTSSGAQSVVGQTDRAGATPKSEIVVNGSRWKDDDEIEPEMMAIVGSRIPHLVKPIFPTLASYTGGNGLIMNGSEGFDMLAGGVRNRNVRKCRVPGSTITPATACAFADVVRQMDRQDWSAARTRAETIERQRTLNEEERYAVQGYLYRIATASGDKALKERALTNLVAGGHLPREDAIAAARTLAAMRYDAGDQGGALRYFQSLAEIEPADEQTRANIAALYQRAGQYAEAKVAIRQAIQLAQHNGHEVPAAWTDNAR